MVYYLFSLLATIIAKSSLSEAGLEEVMPENLLTKLPLLVLSVSVWPRLPEFGNCRNGP